VYLTFAIREAVECKNGGAMRKVVLFFCLIIFMGCASTMTRYGYNLQSLSTNSQCEIPIKKNFPYKRDEVEILGSIKAGDSGFSVKCGEAYVLNQFRQEACALGADLINITDESRFDILSTCYRAKAEFLRFKDREKVKRLVSDPMYIR
jgi:hypothetical protein